MSVTVSVTLSMTMPITVSETVYMTAAMGAVQGAVAYVIINTWKDANTHEAALLVLAATLNAFIVAAFLEEAFKYICTNRVVCNAQTVFRECVMTVFCLCFVTVVCACVVPVCCVCCACVLHVD